MRPRFSRVVAVLALAGATLAAASGCGKVELANDWPAIAEPTGWEPKAGACSSSFSEVTYRSAYRAGDCSGAHRYETVHIGQFKGDAAALTKPPAADSTAMQAAWAECDTKTTEFLGGEWRGGFIDVDVSLPSAGNWEGGARWFLCEVSSPEKDYNGVRDRSASLKGEFAGDSSLEYGCSMRTDGQPTVFVACTEPHNTEFVGVFNATDSREEIGKNLATVHQKCRSLIAAYTGVPDDGNMKYRTGSWYFVASDAAWAAGDRGVRCFMWMGSKKFTRSVKGGGTKVLPINYA